VLLLNKFKKGAWGIFEKPGFYCSGRPQFALFTAEFNSAHEETAECSGMKNALHFTASPSPATKSLLGKGHRKQSIKEAR
jgi:hypothetical protein